MDTLSAGSASGSQAEGAGAEGIVRPWPYDAIFFDMDGTLLPMDVRQFLDDYYVYLRAKLAPEHIDTELFIAALNRGMNAMSSHPSGETNADAFWRMFAVEYEEQEHPLNAADLERAHDFLIDFYRNEFDECGRNVVPNPWSRRVVETLKEKGYPLYLTTMPLFPREGVETRLKWADVDPKSFLRITTYANSTAVKPQLAFYYENLAIAGAIDEPERVLMVGNNTIDDLVCLQAGIDAFLVTDELINKNDFDVETVMHGTMEEFFEFASNLPPCGSTRAAQGFPDRSPLDGGFSTDAGRDAQPIPFDEY